MPRGIPTKRSARAIRELQALLHYSDERLCLSCDASIAASGDDLCASCRLEIDAVYGDLPGAEP